MKRINYLLFVMWSIGTIAQTNSLPTTGNVGIGTISPNVKLHILETGTGFKTLQQLTTGTYTAGEGAAIFYKTSGSVTLDRYGAKVGAKRNWASNNGAADFVIELENPTVSGLDEVFRIESGGNVGVGTANPISRLTSLSQKHAEKMTLGATDEAALSVKPFNDGGYGLHFGVGGSGKTWIQGGRTDGATAYDMSLQASGGNVGIGTTSPDSKLTVAGKVHAQEVKVTITAGADFVFEESYQPPTLKELESFIKTNKHLPEIASAKEMETEGLELGEMNIKLLQKIEELTLYTIEQERKLEKLNILEKEVEGLKKQNQRIAKLEMILEEIIKSNK